MFGKKKTPEQISRERTRIMNREMRQMDRQIRKSQAEKKKKQAEMKKMAKNTNIFNRRYSDSDTDSLSSSSTDCEEERIIKSLSISRPAKATSNFVIKGTEIIKQAVQKDNAEEYESALSLYSQGIQYLMTGLKYEKHPKVISSIKKNVQGYLQRAEDIKTALQEPPKKSQYPNRHVVVFVPPFVNKIVSNWSVDDVQDWIDNIKLNEDEKFQYTIKQHKKTMKQIVSKNQITGKLLIQYGSGKTIYELFGHQYGISQLSQTFCSKLWSSLQIILKQPICICGRYLQKRLIKNVYDGIGLVWCNHCKNDLCTKSIHEFVYHCPAEKVAQHVSGYDLCLTCVKQNKANIATNFEVGQRVEACDRQKWYPAIIKDTDLMNNRITIGWLCDKWASERYDMIFTSGDIQNRIRDPKTKQAYKPRIISEINNNINNICIDADDVKVDMTPSFKWKNKNIEHWNCQELQGWILSLTQLSVDVRSKVCQAIRDCEMGGMDFYVCTADDITDLFENIAIDASVGNKIYKSLVKLRKNRIDNNQLQHSKQMTPQYSIANKESKNKSIKHWRNKDLLDWIKTIGLTDKWEEIMIEIIKSSGCVGMDWLVIENFKDLAKALNIKQAMLANRVFREFKKVKQKQVKDNELPSFAEVTSKQSRIVYVWESKHINEWTCNEFEEWICSLKLGKSIEKRIVEAVAEQEITGEDFNSIENMSDVVDSFEIKETEATIIYSALQTVRMNQKKIKCVGIPGNTVTHKAELSDHNKGNKQMNVSDPVELLKKWNLSQYKTVLIDEEGYDDPLYWKDISVQELKQMGFRTGHAKKFADKCGQLL